MKWILISLYLFLFVKLNGQQEKDVFDQYFDTLMRNRQIPGVSFLIAKDGIVMKEAAYGFSNLENNVKAGISTKYEIASVTKPFTATAVMILVEQGKLDLDSFITEYLTNVPETHKSITVRQLLSHTSGLQTDHYDPTKLFGPSVIRYSAEAQLIDLFKKELKFSPGTDFNYSNGGYFLASVLIEKFSGLSYQEFIRKNIFEKAGMMNSSFINGDSIVPYRAQGYTLRKSTLVRFSLEQSIQSMDINGFGSIISNTHDLLKWVTALSEKKVISQQTFEQMMTPTLLPDGTMTGPPNGSRIGLGWFVRNIEGRKTISHSGHTGTFMIYFPVEKMIVVMLTNLGAGYPRMDHGFRTVDTGFELAGIAARKYLK